MRERLQAWADYFAGVGIALWFAAGVLKVLGRISNEWGIALVGLGILFLALYAYAKSATVQAAVTSRSVRYGSNALVLSVAFVGIVVLLNFLGSRYHYRMDWTANQTFTLSPQTIKVLDSLNEPVQAIALYTEEARLSQPDVEERLKQYAAQSAKFTYRFIDWQAEPQAAREYQVEFGNKIVVQRGTRRESVLGSDEQSLTNAILKVAQDTKPAIYFTTGHGEHNPNDFGDNGYNSVKLALESKNYQVEIVDLRTLTTTLPADVAAVVIAGPTQPFDPREVGRLIEYLSKNGHMFVMVDPQLNPGLDDLLKPWGLKLRDDAVIDLKYGFFGDAQVPAITTFKNHPVTKALSGMTTVFPDARSAAADTPSPTGINLSALFSTSDASWGETDFAGLRNQKAQFDANADAKGPLDLAYAAEKTGAANPARLVVLGNSTFVVQGWLNTVRGSANTLLFTNIVEWLTGQENLIDIPPKTAEPNMVFLTTEQSTFVFVSSFFLLPAAILIIGALAWWRRR